MGRAETFRIAVRKYGPFETAIAKQWASFEATAKTGFTLEAVAMDLHPLEEALFGNNGMANGAWDVCFVATDWIAAMHKASAAVDLAPLLAQEPLAESAWSDSLLRLQRIGDVVLGTPYHDGPECLIYRTDIFSDKARQSTYQRRFHKPLSPPATWEEFHQVARFLNTPEQGCYGTVIAAFPDSHNSVYDFLLQLWTREEASSFCDTDGTICFQTTAAADSLTFYRRLLRDSTAVHPRCRELDSVQAGISICREVKQQ